MYISIERIDTSVFRKALRRFVNTFVQWVKKGLRRGSNRIKWLLFTLIFISTSLPVILIIVRRHEETRSVFYGFALLLTSCLAYLIIRMLISIDNHRLREKAIVESSTDAIFTTLLDGTINNWNKGAENIYGHRREEIIGKNLGCLLM